MKSTIVAILFFACFFFISCDPPAQFSTQLVKLKAQINDTAETIQLGDTLKFTLTIPDTTVVDSGRIQVKSVQQAFYSYTLSEIDSPKTERIAFRVPNVTNFATNGLADGYVLNMSPTTKPYQTTLNFVPTHKGLYVLQISQQSGAIKFNDGYTINLAVNFDVLNKHWYIFDRFNSGFIDAVIPVDYAGYGAYCFRVN